MLKGKNIVLRPLQNTDLDFLFEIENNIENWQFGSEKKKYNKQELLDYIKNAQTDISLAKQYRFVIDLNSIPIGFIDLFNYTNDSLKHIKINIYGHSKYKRTRNNPASRVDVTESVSARQRWRSTDSPKDASAPF